MGDDIKLAKDEVELKRELNKVRYRES